MLISGEAIASKRRLTILVQLDYYKDYTSLASISALPALLSKIGKGQNIDSSPFWKVPIPIYSQQPHMPMRGAARSARV